jgi:hypothetical protein
MRTFRPLVVAFHVLLAAGCSSTSSTARTRAANDFACDEEKVEVADIGGTSYRVTGCGRTAVYDCSESASHGFAFFRRHEFLCVPEQASVAVATAPAE